MTETVYNRIKYVYDELNQQHYTVYQFEDIERRYKSEYQDDITIFRDDQFVVRYDKAERIFSLETTFSNQKINHEYINKMECLYEVVKEANQNIKNIPYS